MTEWAEAGRHLGPRPARTWRGARTQGRQGSKRPPGQDPDRAIHLSFYLSAGIAAHGPSEHATSAHRHIQIPLVCGTSRRQGISLSSTGTTLGTSLGSTPSEPRYRYRYRCYESSKDKPDQFRHDPGPGFPCALLFHPGSSQRITIMYHAGREGGDGAP